MNRIKIAVCGAAGRMGSSIIRLAQADAELEVSAAVDARPEAMFFGGTVFKGKASADLAGAGNDFSVIIDFSSIDGALRSLDFALKNKKAIVIGTTGFSDSQTEKIKSAARDIPVVLSPNMSVGVNLLFKLAYDAAKALPGYDAEIVELHHNQKKDSPSGTAARLAPGVASALGIDLSKNGIYGRFGNIGARKKNEIGVMSVRAGDIVGEHTLYLAGPGERLELTHKAHSRDNFASGALQAAKWLSSKPAGFYDMQDVLGLKIK